MIMAAAPIHMRAVSHHGMGLGTSTVFSTGYGTGRSIVSARFLTWRRESMTCRYMAFSLCHSWFRSVTRSRSLPIVSPLLSTV